MSRKTKIDKTADNVELRYSNWFSTMVNFISPKNLWVVAGRATSKTEDILAERLQEISYDMPGAFIAITSDTFMNAQKNIIPGIIEGWKRKGWKEGIHYVIGEKPPKHFKKPYKVVLSWRHTITVMTGTHFMVISQDRPSIGAGNSFQHKVGDEAKYLVEKKLNKLSPAIRGGEIRLMKSHFYGGSTFLTDMPNINHGEHDWILRMEKNMDKKQILRILKTASVVNEIRIELMNEKRGTDDVKIKLLEKNLQRWEHRLNVARKNSTFFYRASSFVNVDILKIDFFKTLLQEMNFREFMVSVLSISPKLEKGQMFYPTLTARNFFDDGFTYSNFDSFSHPLDHVSSSLDLKYIHHNEPIEAGLDVGNMCSLTMGQPQGNEIYRLLKFLYTLAPEFLPHLGKKFRDFFMHHQNKHLILYHDRDANKYQSVGEDHASKFKKAIEYDEDNISTGWTVTLMNREQATIYHQQEYELMLQFFSGSNKSLPKLLIDKHNCKEVKSSCELAEKIEKVNGRTGAKTIHKNKTSEKLQIDLLPMFSTNPSDSVKYLLCRPEFLEKIYGETYTDIGDPGVH